MVSLARHAARFSDSTDLDVGSRCLLNHPLKASQVSRLPLLTALQGSCIQSFLCNSQSHCFLSFQVVWIKLQAQMTAYFFWSHWDTCISWEELLCLWPSTKDWTLLLPLNTYPVTGRTTWWVGCSRWSTSHSYLCVGLERENQFPFTLPSLFFLETECTKLRGESKAPSPEPCLTLQASSMPTVFSTYYSFSVARKNPWLSDDCFHEMVQHVKLWLSLIVQLCRV